jgi:hypothetical protein
MDGELRELGEGLYEYTGRFALHGGKATWKHVGTIVGPEVIEPADAHSGHNELARALFQVNYARVGKWRNKRKDSERPAG